MFKTFKIFLLFVIFITSTTALAASGSSSWGKVSEVYVHGGWTMVRVTGVSENPSQCTGITYYALHPSDANYEVLHSTLLAAHLANKDVRFWLNGCSGQNNKYPHIVSVFIR